MRENCEESADRKATEPRGWTIMIYMAGDNNLSPDMATSLRALSSVNRPDDDCDENKGRKKGGNSEDASNKVNLLAYFDSASLTAPTQYIDFSEAQPCAHDVTPEDLILPGDCNSRGGDPEDSASVRSILAFVQWCIKKRNATADNYMLIFSGHSFGFSGTSFLRDQSTGRFLSLRRFRYALEEANRLFLFPENDARPPGEEARKIALIGFDSCDMGMLEVGYELKEVVNTVVASAGNVPNAGWGYAAMLRDLIQTGDFVKEQKSIGIVTQNEITNAAKGFVQKYICQQQEYAIGGMSVDMAAFNLDKIETLAKHVGELGEILTDMLGLDCLLKGGKITKEEALIHNRTKDLIARSRMTCQSYMHEQSVDVRDFCQRLMFGCREIRHELKMLKQAEQQFNKLQEQCRKIIEAADKFVLQSGFSGDEYQFSKGLSLYFPWTALTFLFTWGVYGNLRFCIGDYQEVPSRDGTGFEKKKVGPGAGEAWESFLVFYLYIVTLRVPETIPQYDQAYRRLSNGSVIDGDWQQTRQNWLDTRMGRPEVSGPAPDKPWPQNTRENWRVGTRENWPVTGTRENWWIGTRENWWLGTRENWRVGTRDNPLTTGNRGMSQDYMIFFLRIRNFVLNWEARGFWPKPEKDCQDGSKPRKKTPTEPRTNRPKSRK